jgi:cytochrome oxidase Cu insertion factor (SCO1/SenC/PrrC family)
MHRPACLTLLLAGAVFALWGCGRSGDQSLEKMPPRPSTPLKVGLQVGNLAPEIDGEDADGRSFKLSDYRGKVVLLDFWAGW